MVISAVFTFITGGGLVAMVRLWQDRRKPAVDVRAVEVATQGDQVSMSVELAAAAMAQVKDMAEQLKTVRAESAEASRVAHVAEQVATDLSTWAHNIVQNWATIRLRETPPELPASARKIIREER